MTGKNLSVDRDDRIKVFLDHLFSTTCCSWCRDHTRRLYGERLPLCGSCVQIQRGIRKYEKLASKHRPKSSRSFDHYRYELAVARHKRTLAHQDGVAFGGIASRPVDALDLERILARVSKLAVRRRAVTVDAIMLNDFYSKPQQRLLFYMMSEIVRAHRCRHRTHIARWALVR